MPFFVAHTLQNDDCKRGSNHAKKLRICFESAAYSSNGNGRSNACLMCDDEDGPSCYIKCGQSTIQGLIPGIDSSQNTSSNNEGRKNVFENNTIQYLKVKMKYY